MIDVVIPVLDEVGALPWVLGRMPAGYRPVVVDNGSGDGSAEVAGRLGALVVPEPRRGFGAACHAGLLAATSEVVCFLDGDASLDPAELPMVAGPVAAGRADLMLGARRAEPGAWPAHARLANRCLAFELRRRSGAALTDLGPMRAARRADLLALDVSNRRSGWPLEMVLLATAAGWRVAEVPVAYRRRTGKSKVTGTVAGTVRAVRDMAAVLTGAKRPSRPGEEAPASRTAMGSGGAAPSGGTVTGAKRPSRPGEEAPASRTAMGSGGAAPSGGTVTGAKR